MIRWLNRSIHVRIVAGTFVLALCAVAIAAVLAVSGVGVLLRSSTDALLRDDIAPIAEALEGMTPDGTGTSDMDEPSDGQQVAAVAPGGRVMLSTLPQGIRPLPDDRSEGVSTVAVGGIEYRVLRQSVAGPGGEWHLVAARATNADDALRSSLATSIVIAGLLLLLLVTAASWFLVSAALAPVERLRRGAAELARRPDGGLLPVRPSRDEIDRLAVTLNELITETRAASARERQLISDASHELRTPLSLLRLQLELALSQGATLETLRADVAAAHSAAVRASDLAADLLELSRIDAAAATASGSGDPTGSGAAGSSAAGTNENGTGETGTAAAQAARVTVADAAAELTAAVDLVREAQAVHRASIDFAIDLDDDSAIVPLSPGDFGRVVANLVANGVAALDGEGAVQATLRTSQGQLELTVVDEGRGLAAEHRERAFTRFWRAPGARAGTGTGLGLPIVRALAEYAGGTAELRGSPTGTGTVAVVRMPLRPAGTATVHAAAD